MWLGRKSPITGARWFIPVARPVWMFVLSSCLGDGDEAGSAAQPVRSDSAGVEMVGNVQPLWSGDGGWRIAEEPDLRIGNLEGAADDILHEIVAVRDLGDTILVAQQTELRLYRHDGSFIRRMGAAGDGPGEFFQITDILRCGDRIYASEQSPPRLIVFDPSGESLTVPLPQPEQGFLNPLTPLWACTPDGVLGGMSGTMPEPEDPRSPEIQRRRGLAVHVRLDGTGLDTLMSFPGPETYRGLIVPFGRRTLVAAGDAVLYLADSGLPEVRVLRSDGVTRRIVRLGLPAREVTSADVERIRSQYLDGHSSSIVGEIAALLDAIPVPETMPYFSQLKLAPDGTLWLQYHQAFRDEEMRRWTVVDSAGAWLGDVEMPDGFTVHHFGNNDVIGVWRDDLGVEFIRRYSIQK